MPLVGSASPVRRSLSLTGQPVPQKTELRSSMDSLKELCRSLQQSKNAKEKEIEKLVCTPVFRSLLSYAFSLFAFSLVLALLFCSFFSFFLSFFLSVLRPTHGRGDAPWHGWQFRRRSCSPPTASSCRGASEKTSSTSELEEEGKLHACKKWGGCCCRQGT